MKSEIIRFQFSISTPEMWYRKSTREYVISCLIETDNTIQAINFTSKKPNKAKKMFYKYILQNSPISEEFRYLVKKNRIHIVEKY